MMKNILYTLFFLATVNANAQAPLYSKYNYDEFIYEAVQKECIEEAKEMNIPIVTDLSEIKVYPNPAINYFSITNNNLVQFVQVYNIIGRKVKSYPVQNGLEYDISDLPEGMYLISLVGADGKVLKTVRTSKQIIRP